MQAGANNLFGRVEPLEIEMGQGKAPFRIFVNEGEGRGLDAGFDSEPSRQPNDELGLARAEVACQADHCSGFNVASPAFAEGHRLIRAMRNECSHGQ